MIKVLYATMTGNSKFVAEVIEKSLESNNVESKVIDILEVDFQELSKEDLHIIVTSTHRQGEINDIFTSFHEELKNNDLTGYKFALTGLGDRIYGEHLFCLATTQIRETISKSNGEVLSDTLEIDGSPHSFPSQNIYAWVFRLLEEYKSINS